MVEPAALPEPARALLLLLRSSADAVRVDPSWADELAQLVGLELAVELGSDSKRSHVRLTLAGRVVADQCRTWDVLAADDEAGTLEQRTLAAQAEEQRGRR